MYLAGTNSLGGGNQGSGGWRSEVIVDFCLDFLDDLCAMPVELMASSNSYSR